MSRDVSPEDLRTDPSTDVETKGLRRADLPTWMMARLLDHRADVA